MLIRTILVCLTTPEHAETLMKLAVPLARRHDAHLIGLHTIEALVVYPGIAMHIPQATFAAFNQSQTDAGLRIERIFDKYTEAEEIQSEYRMIRAEAVSANVRMVESARAADLVIMAREDAETDRLDQRDAQVQVIRECGRPVLVVPPGYEGSTPGDTLMLGWSDTREAARAAHDMVTLAQPGAQVTVLRVGDHTGDSLRDSAAIDLVETLARHGLEATLDHREAGGHGIADVLNQCAFEQGADVIVTGAFGHSKVYDFVMGATTYALLKNARLPVLFSK